MANVFLFPSVFKVGSGVSAGGTVGMYEFLRKTAYVAAPLKVSDISSMFSTVSGLAVILNRWHENRLYLYVCYGDTNTQRITPPLFIIHYFIVVHHVLICQFL